MEYLSNRIKSISVSQTLEMAQKSRDLKAAGIDVISLCTGEPDFNTPDDIKEAAKRAIDDNYSFYPPVPGYLNVILSIVNPGDEVIILAPYWVSYYDQVIFAEGKPVVLKTTIENDFKVTPDQLESAITSKTRAILFNSPSNPTGMVYTRDEMEAIARVVEKYEGVFVISDEIYEHITFSGKHVSMASFDFIFDRVITVNGVSKGYAMTGWRIGYIGAPLWLAKAVNKLQGQFTSGVSSIAQRAALAAVTSKSDSKEKMKAAYLKRRDLVCGLLSDIKGFKVRVPQGAFYVFMEASYFFGKRTGDSVIKDSTDLTMYILGNAHVAVVGGEAFGAPDCIRISYSVSDEELIEACRRMKESLAKLT